MNKNVFVYVGHSNWGKSSALKILTNGSSQSRQAYISNQTVYVRKMSNDDDGLGLLRWVKEISRMNYQNFIIAFCPNFPSPQEEATDAENRAIYILTELQRTNKLFFFIQEEKFNFPEEKISLSEINMIKNFGVHEILRGQNPDYVRADAFKRFIESYI